MADRKTLLLVEDETSILFSVQRILELSGDYEVITAANGKTAINKLAQVIPDLIISDIAMPEMDGIEFCKHVRKSEATRSIPFIFLTAKKERILEGIQTGSDDYIVKPFKVDELLVKIKSIFQRIESRREEALVQKGSLSDYNLDEILELCMKDAFSGELDLKNDNDEGIIYLEKGEISEIKLSDHDEDQALDSLRKWSSGSFVLRPKTIEIKSRRNSKRKGYRDKLIDLSLPVEIAKDTWWAGRRNPASLLQTNVYLRQFKAGQKLINYLFNPGPISDYSVISQKLSAILNEASPIHVFNLNQQDAYVTQNVQFIKKSNPKAICVTTEGNWRLLAACDINEKNVKYVNKMKDWRVKLATQHELAYISAPFCPARSTFLTYDLETRVLFCGELFSGILDRDNYSSFWMEGDQMDGILAYHQLHMPASNAIRYVIQSIRQLDPTPLMIAPLYGNIIRGDHVNEVIDQIDSLKVGSDLLHIKSTPEQAALYLEAANEILASAYDIFTVEKVTKKLSADDRIQKLCQLKDGQVRSLNHQRGRVLEQMINIIVIGEHESLSNQLKSEALKAVVSRKLPPIAIGRDTTESMVKIPRNIFRN